MAVFGGHGYIHENGMEQLLRDACIVPLYEGTNGIQALDLVHRKLPADDGKAIQAFIEGVAASIEMSRGNEALRSMCVQLEPSLDALRGATRLMRDRAASDALGAAAGASDYLRMLGLVACGHAWLRMAAAAQAGVAAGVGAAESPAFYRGKIKTARFFMAHLLPDTARLAHAIQAGADAVTDIQPDEL
jgi:hypothetical protein